MRWRAPRDVRVVATVRSAELIVDVRTVHFPVDSGTAAQSAKRAGEVMPSGAIATSVVRSRSPHEACEPCVCRRITLVRQLLHTLEQTACERRRWLNQGLDVGLKPESADPIR